MGFGEEELDALKHPALISVLANANVSWCSVSVNREVLRRLLKQAQDVEKEIATVDRMLRLGPVRKWRAVLWADAPGSRATA